MKLICGNCGIIAEEGMTECNHSKVNCKPEHVFVYNPTKRFLARLLIFGIGILMYINANVFLNDNFILGFYVFGIVGTLLLIFSLFFYDMKTKPSSIIMILNCFTFSVLLFIYIITS